MRWGGVGGVEGPWGGDVPDTLDAVPALLGLVQGELEALALVGAFGEGRGAADGAGGVDVARDGGQGGHGSVPSCPDPSRGRWMVEGLVLPALGGCIRGADDGSSSGVASGTTCSHHGRVGLVLEVHAAESVRIMTGQGKGRDVAGMEREESGCVKYLLC